MKKFGTFLAVVIGVIYVFKYPGETVDAGQYVIRQLVTFVEEI